MKSKIESVLIAPTDLLMDRKLKYYVKGVGWRDKIATGDGRADVRRALNIEAVLDPDCAHVGLVEYYVKDLRMQAELKMSVIYGYNKSKLAPLLFYKKNCRKSNEEF